MHSGLQVGGAPKYPATQEQTGCPLISRQILFGPHGVGEHGLPFSVSDVIKSGKNSEQCYSKYFE